MNVRLKQLRRQREGLTQQALAERIGVTRQTIISIERGNYSPSVELALRLAAVLDLPVEEIFSLDDESEGSP